jgi:hypothetical protein
MRKVLKAKARIEVLRREEERRQEEYETENARPEDVKGKALTAKHNRTALEGMKQDLGQYAEKITELENTWTNAVVPPIREGLEKLGLVSNARIP